MYKSVILIGGPQKGTRFRPLSFDIPKPLFPVAGVPTIQHLIEACCKVPNMREILLIGFYQADEAIIQFAASMMKEYNINIRYLQEYTTLGTAGGMYHFRDQIRSGSPEAFFLINGDVCGNFPLLKMVEFHRNRPKNVLITVLGTEATRQQSQQYGCIVENKDTHEIMHYVEKPSTFVSNIINCGVYVCSLDIFSHLASVFKQKQEDYYYGSAHFDTCSIGDPKIVKSVMPHQVQHSEWHAFNDAPYPGLQSFGVWHRDEHLSETGGNGKDCIRLEQDILMPLAGTGQILVYNSPRWWSQIKTAGSAIYANRHYLELYHETHPDWLACSGEKKPIIIGDVFIHPTATVHPTATLGPNVSIGKNAIISAGVRIRESIVLGNATIQDHSLILHSIIGWNSTVGAWARVEGTPCDPNPNKPFAKMENVPLFNHNGRLNPSITVLGCNVQVPPEVIVLNSIVLPHKDLSQSYKNEIIL